jgi:uncharacterized protein YcbK (DUF882 family)
VGERIGLQLLPQGDSRRRERNPGGYGKRQLLSAVATLTAVIALGSAPPQARAAQSSAQSVTPPTANATTATSSGTNWLDLHNTHTGETLKITFRDEKGTFIPTALEQLSKILGDHRSHQQTTMDPQLFTLLADLAASAGVEPHYEIISGYRSPETNEKLRSNGGGQAKNSQHIRGKAIDVRLKGVPTATLRDLARALKRGGVGYYPKSDFVHVDTARVRYWEG